jgi:hypothetical protein
VVLGFRGFWVLGRVILSEEITLVVLNISEIIDRIVMRSRVILNEEIQIIVEGDCRRG